MDAAVVWSPDTLPLDGLLCTEGRRIAEGVLLLGHFVYEGLANDARCRDTGRVPLKAEYLRAVIGRHHLDRVRHAAQRVGYIAWGRSYRAGQRSQRYEVLEPYASARLLQRKITDAALRKNLQSWRERRRQEMWGRIRRNETPVDCEVVEHLWRHLQRIRLEGDIDLGGHLHSAHQIAVDQIRHGDLRISVDDYGRIHTNLTNLKSELRGNLRVDGRRLANVDIGESQPLLIGLVVATAWRRQEGSLQRGKGQETRRADQKQGKQGRRTNTGDHMMDSTMMDKNMMDMSSQFVWQIERCQLPDDLNLYLAACEQRGFYQKVADSLGTTRDQAKRKVLAALFDRPSHRNRVHAVLERTFPTLMHTVAQLKRDDYRRLAHFAQRIESRFMFGRVIPRLMRERPDSFAATIHDSLLIPRGNAEFIRELMLDEFAGLGVSPQVRIEQC